MSDLSTIKLRQKYQIETGRYDGLMMAVQEINKHLP